MERTIKFRGYSKANKKWVYGYLVIDRDGICCIFYYDSLNQLHEIVVEPESVGQFTGLPDCNNKEIYEGDIVKGKYSINGVKHRFIGVVTFVHTTFVVCGVKQYRGMHQQLNGIYGIIGNIYENPELITLP